MPDQDQRKIYLLSDEEITALVQRCAKAGVDAYRDQEQEQRRREAKANDRTRRMKDKLSCYRRVKRTLKEEQEYTAAEKYEYRLKFLEDLMGDPARNNDRTERILIDREEKRRQDYYSICQIDSALELYRQECEASGNEEYNRRFRVLRSYYIDDEATSIADIATLENVSENTIYRDINIACGIMYQYVIGM